MKDSRITKASTLIIIISIAISMTYDVHADLSNQIHTYEYTPIPNDFTLEIKSHLEAYPNQTISINMTIKALVSLTINDLTIKLYTFNDSKFDEITYVENANPMSLTSGKLLNKSSKMRIHEQASNIIYGRLKIKWTKTGTVESITIEKESTFILTFLRDPDLDKLRAEVPELKKENTELKGNITSLNDSLTELHGNLTDFENRYEGELSGTRSVVTILAITTIFFVATTAYLFVRKPKQYW